MTLYLDKKYVNLIAGRLPLFKWERENLANFRCPYCGDSKKHKYKKRGYFYEIKEGLAFKCQNCGHATTFSQFLKDTDHSYYKEYLFEKFKDGHKYQRTFKVDKPIPDGDLTKELSQLVAIKELPDSHPAKRYLVGRKIPTSIFNKMFYTNNFKKWVHEHVDSSKFENIPENDERIVIPFYTKSGKPFAFQGRALDKNDPLRYITIKKDNNLLVYGLDRVDVTKTIYLTEGPFDSLFLTNGIAAAGSSLKRMVSSELDLVFIFDNEPRSKEILNMMEEIIKKNRKIVIFPPEITLKDLNDMVLSGIDVQKLVKKNTYQGLAAQLKFGDWRKS